MLNIGAGEWIVIILVLLVFVGPEQLPGLVRRTGHVVGQFRSLSDRLRSDFTSSMSEIEAAADVRAWTAPDPDDTGEPDEPESVADNADQTVPKTEKPSDQADTASAMPRNYLKPSEDLDWVSTAPGPFAASKPADEETTPPDESVDRSAPSVESTEAGSAVDSGLVESTEGGSAVDSGLVESTEDDSVGETGSDESTEGDEVKASAEVDTW